MALSTLIMHVVICVGVQWMKEHGGNIINCSMGMQNRGAPMWTHSGAAKVLLIIIMRCSSFAQLLLIILKHCSCWYSGL